MALMMIGMALFWAAIILCFVWPTERNLFEEPSPGIRCIPYPPG